MSYHDTISLSQYHIVIISYHDNKHDSVYYCNKDIDILKNYLVSHLNFKQLTRVNNG